MTKFVRPDTRLQEEPRRHFGRPRVTVFLGIVGTTERMA